MTGAAAPRADHGPGPSEPGFPPRQLISVLTGISPAKRDVQHLFMGLSAIRTLLVVTDGRFLQRNTKTRIDKQDELCLQSQKSARLMTELNGT